MTIPDTKFEHQQPYKLAILEAYVAHRGNKPDAPRGVFWYGAAGSGKTWTAESFAEHWQSNGVQVWHGSALEIVAEVQASIGRNKDARDLFTMIYEVKRAGVVLIDDLGRERDGFGQSTLFTLLDAALNGDAFVIVTANRDAKALATYYGDDAGLRSRLSALVQQEWPATLPNARKVGPYPSHADAERAMVGK